MKTRVLDGEKIKEIRKKRKYTFQQMADALGISRRAYQAYERDESEPTLAGLAALANILNIRVDELLLTDTIRFNLISDKADLITNDFVSDVIQSNTLNKAKQFQLVLTVWKEITKFLFSKGWINND